MNKVKYNGVSLHKGRNRWQARLRINGRLFYIGEFDYEEDAARAVDQAFT